MLTATRTERAGRWPAASAGGAVTLAYDDRHRRRLRLTSDAGEAFLLDLPRATILAEGDGLALSDGRWLAVRAAPEALVEIVAPELVLLARIAWHLGNRHFPAQIEAGRILIRRDHVICDMLIQLGATLRFLEAPFTPERGAYDETSAHHHHDHDRDHDHRHFHQHRERADDQP